MAEKPSFHLTGKQALVTGGRSGIGLAIAEAFRDYGAKVTVTGVQEGTQGEAAITAEGLSFRRLDVRDLDAISALAREIERLDILVNCAGIVVREGREYAPEVFSDVLDVNLTGSYRMCHAFMPHLRASRGCIINIASMTSFAGSPHAPAYGASKAAIVQLTKTLAIAWAPDGVRVNAIAPGWIRTKLNRVMQENPEFSRRIEQRTPMGRWGLPEELTGAAVFLASPAAAFVTGITLPVDGGYLAA